MAKICGMQYNRCEQIDALKQSAICDFQDLLLTAEKGHRFSYEMILEKISLIGIAEEMSLNKIDYFTNYYNSLQWKRTVKPY